MMQVLHEGGYILANQNVLQPMVALLQYLYHIELHL